MTESHQFKVAFLRRGFSPSGGAEAYLKRLAAGVCDAGHEAALVTTAEWPREEWPFGPLTALRGESPVAFADAFETARPSLRCDVVMSLERVWRCDVFRAGDGVHQSWLQRRDRFAGPLQKLRGVFNRKQGAILRLERSLFADGNAGRVIANSRPIKEEITNFYSYPRDRIDVIYNGVPAASFRGAADQREQSRARLGVAAVDIVVLFVGSGWERKGLRYAIQAVESLRHPKTRLLVAGRGNEARYRSPAVQFLGVAKNLPELYAAADALLLPTIYDPFSNACLEAVAAGLPVITTRANGFSEIIEDAVHGSIVDEPDDAGAIAAAVGMWSDRTRREEARPRLYDLAAKHDISVNVRRTLEILVQAASAASTSGKIRNT